VVVVTGAAGFIGTAAVKIFTLRGLTVVGIDNDMHGILFGEEGTCWQRDALVRTVPRYRHLEADVRDEDVIRQEFQRNAAISR
jgi:nucleoside-diphosphate-sugar epimerase